MIWEELKTNLIFIDLDAKDTKEVFEQVGEPLSKKDTPRKPTSRA